MSVSTAMAASNIYAVGAYGAQLSGQGLRGVCNSGVQFATVSYTSQSNTCGIMSYTNEGQETTVVVKCSQMQEDIHYCQEMGVKILVSTSGVMSDYVPTTEKDGEELGQWVYNAFGPLQAGYTGPRPFDSADQQTKVDGYVIDSMSIIEESVSIGMVRTWRKQSTKSLVAACLQCNEELAAELEVDYLVVRFDKCQTKTSRRESSYNKFVNKIQKTKSKFAKIFIGISAYREETEFSYVSVDQMKRIACEGKRKGNFAGIALFGLRLDLSITKTFIKSSYEAINADTCDVGFTTETSAIPISSSSTQAPITSSTTQAPFTTATNTQGTVSTVYTTIVHTVTDCPTSVTDCPIGHVTTETISLYTTFCPQPTAVPAKPSSPVCQGSECDDEEECFEEDCFEECYGEDCFEECHGEECVEECYGDECVEECYGEECVEECYGEECVEEHGSKQGSKHGSKQGSNNGCVGIDCVEEHGSKHGSHQGCVGAGCAPATNGTGATNGTNNGCVGIYCPTSTAMKTACVGTGCPGVAAPTNKVTTPTAPGAPVKAGASSVTLSLTGLAALMVAQLLL